MREHNIDGVKRKDYTSWTGTLERFFQRWNNGQKIKFYHVTWYVDFLTRFHCWIKAPADGVELI